MKDSKEYITQEHIIEDVLIDASKTHQEIFNISKLPKCFSFSIGSNVPRQFQYTDISQEIRISKYNQKIGNNDSNYKIEYIKIHLMDSWNEIFHHILEILYDNLVKKGDFINNSNHRQHFIDGSIIILNKNNYIKYKEEENFYHTNRENFSNYYLNEFSSYNIVLKGTSHIHIQINERILHNGGFSEISFKIYFNFYRMKIYLF